MAGWRIGGGGGAQPSLAFDLTIPHNQAVAVDFGGASAVHLHLQERGNPDCAGLFNLDLATPAASYFQASAEFDAGTGVYGGTDGPATRITVSAAADGKLYVENQASPPRTLVLACTSTRPKAG